MAVKMVKINVIEAHPVMQVNLSLRKNTSSYVLTTIFQNASKLWYLFILLVSQLCKTV